MSVFGDYNTPGDDPRNFPQQPSPLAARYNIGRPGTRSLADILRGSIVSSLDIHPLGAEEAGNTARAAAGLPPLEIKQPQSNVAPTDEHREDRSGVNPGYGHGYPASVPLANSTPTGPRSFSETVQANMAKTLGQHPYDTREGPLRSAETPAASAVKPAMRAIRLPTGKVLFTNQNYGGDEFTGGTAAAGAEIRAQDRARNQQDPVGRTMLSLIRSSTGDLTNASRMQAAVRGETGTAPAPQPTHRVEGPAFNNSPGVSMIEGTPLQQQEAAIEAGGRELALAQTGQELKAANMAPGQVADLSNQRLRLGAWLNTWSKPEMDQIVAEGAKRRAEIASTVPPAQQAKELQEEQMITEARLKNVRDRMIAISGQGIPSF